MFQQDIATWMQVGAAGSSPSLKHEPPTAAEPAPTHNPIAPNSSLFFPAWEILPHDERLPHVDVIGDRLETLVALTRTPGEADSPSPLVATSVTALLQRTFPRNTFDARLRTVRRGEQVEPLDLVEWLEDQGYEPEAQVSHKGEIALRGGILDLFPLTSPWPVRLEFFGNEIESLRYFDPLTQISREEIESVTIPPAGELGLLKRQLAAGKPNARLGEPATLLGYLPTNTIFPQLRTGPLTGSGRGLPTTGARG
jgi:transcription-repair coupling factor (superfamily II helicase)